MKDKKDDFTAAADLADPLNAALRVSGAGKKLDQNADAGSEGALAKALRMNRTANNPIRIYDAIKAWQLKGSASPASGSDAAPQAETPAKQPVVATDDTANAQQANRRWSWFGLRRNRGGPTM